MALYNCAATRLDTASLDYDIAWLMDSLMHGVGVGFEPVRDDSMRIFKPVGSFDYEIPDSREGWCESERLLINAYIRPNQPMPRMIYDRVRPRGVPIRGFGGVASGPEPLRELHHSTIEQFELFGTRSEYDSVYLKANLANLTGCCVVAGNVRRSAELCKGRFSDPIFIDLKNYQRFPEREAFGWMSNNSVELAEDSDFDMLGEIAKRVVRNGEPGYINRINMRRGRIGKNDNLREDLASLFNPCGEIPLENKEVCNVAETCPTMCDDVDEWYDACRHAAFYCSTVSLLPTHSQDTNRIVARNRRIGVSIIDVSGWKLVNGVHKITKWLRRGYKVVRETNSWANDEAGVPRSIRVTTIKPGGTTPKLPGRTPGIGHPTFDFTLRRILVSKVAPIFQLLVNAKIPWEECVTGADTACFEYPILQGPARPAEQVSVWEQAMNLILVQREWADNAVSNTLYFRPRWPIVECIEEDFEDRLAEYIGTVEARQVIANRIREYTIPKKYKVTLKATMTGELYEVNVHEYDEGHEEHDVEAVLSAIAPLTKSVSLLPHCAKGAYKQMPEEGISEEEYRERLSKIRAIDWENFSGSDGVDDKFCSGAACEMVRN